MSDIVSKARNKMDELLPANSLRRRFAKGAIWSALSTGIAQFLGMISAIVVARMLGVEIYGELGVVRKTSSMFGIFAGFGLGLTATRYIAEFRTSNPRRAGEIWGLIDKVAILTSVLVAVLLIIMSPYLASNVLKAPQLSFVLQLSAIALVFETLLGMQKGALAGFESFREMAILNFISGLCNFPIMVLGVYLWGLKGATLGLGLTALSSYMAGEIILIKVSQKHAVRRNWSISFSELPLLWKFSLPTLLTNLLFIISEWVCMTMLVNQVEGYRENGLYNAAYRFTSLITLIPMTLVNPALSLMSNMYGMGEIVKFKKLLWANLKIVSGITLLISAGIGILSPFIMMLYGPEYKEAGLILQLLCVGVVFRAVLLILSQALYSMNLIRLDFMFGILRICVLLGTWYLLLDQGAKGLAIATVISMLVQLLIKGGISLRIIRKLKPQPK